MSKVLCLVAGWGYSGETMYPLRDALLEDINVDEYDVLCTSVYDLLEEDQSYEKCEETKVSNYARSLLRMLEQYPGDVTLIGWSMGGMVALEAATICPGKIKKLILISSTPRFCQDKQDESYSAGVAEKNLRALAIGTKVNTEETLESFYRDAFAPRRIGSSFSSRSSADAVHEHCEVKKIRNLEFLSHGLDYLRQTDLRPSLENIDIPVLLLHGLEDRIIPHRASQYLADQLKVSRYVPLKLVGHAAVLQEPAQISKEVVDFIR